MASIRAASRNLKRPTALIMRDDWYGHRDPFSGEPQGDKDEWLDWDYALVDAVQTIEDLSDPNSGLLRWELDDDDAVVDAVKRIDPFQESIDLATRGENYKPTPGEKWYPDIYRYGGGELQTYDQWIEQQARKRNEED
jgi:hypothetical protein